jgi:hypothetical protein
MARASTGFRSFASLSMHFSLALICNLALRLPFLRRYAVNENFDAGMAQARSFEGVYTNGERTQGVLIYCNEVTLIMSSSSTLHSSSLHSSSLHSFSLLSSSIHSSSPFFLSPSISSPFFLPQSLFPPTFPLHGPLLVRNSGSVGR